MNKIMNCNVVAIKRGHTVVTGAAWNDPTEYPVNLEEIDNRVWVYDGISVDEAIRNTITSISEMACSSNWTGCSIFVNADSVPCPPACKLNGGQTSITVVKSAADADGLDTDPYDPQKVRARAARLACINTLDSMCGKQNSSGPMTVIITAGPTNERIDAVMKITNMSTGSLGKKIAETMLNTDGKHAWCAGQIRKVYYISPKLAYKPSVPDGQAGKLRLVQIESAMDLLDEVSKICSREQVDVIVHSSAVGDYAAKYTARAEDLVAEIIRRQNGKGARLDEAEIMDVFENPPSALNDDTKMSSYEPHMMTMMKLTPKVISRMRDMAPRALIFGFKLLENVSEEHLFGVASALRRKNRVDYVIANDLAKIGRGKHPAMFVGRDNFQECDAVVANCDTKAGIADQICALAFGPDPAAAAYSRARDGSASAYPDTMAGKTYWHVIAANNMNTNVRIEGFASDKAAAWRIMAAEFKRTAAEMAPDVAVPEAEYLYMDHGFDFDDDGKRRLKLDTDGAQVFDGEDMWYWNLVPMCYAAVSPDGCQETERCHKN